MAESKAPNPTKNAAAMWSTVISFPAFSGCILLTFTQSDWRLGASLIAGWLSLAVFIAAGWRMTRGRKAKQINVPRLAIRVALVASVFGFAFLNMICFGNLREYAILSISSSNLRGISIGLRMYCEKEGVPPSSWDDLIRSGISSPGQFIRPLDPDTFESRDGKVVGTSYIYRSVAAACPSKDEEIVAYERLPWTPRDVRLFRRYWRQGITATGKLQFLEEADIERLR